MTLDDVIRAGIGLHGKTVVEEYCYEEETLKPLAELGFEKASDISGLTENIMHKRIRYLYAREDVLIIEVEED